MAMTPEDRNDLIEKITERLQDMPDLDLMRLASQNDIELPSVADKMAKNGDKIPPMIDTSVLTGPINSLKNFLVKKQQDNASQM